MSATKAEFGSGALFKAAGVVYGVMVCSGLVLLANVLVLAAPLLGPVALAGFALTGPSIVAACYAFNRLLSGEDSSVFRDFLKSYRRDFGQSLLVWLPYLALLTVIAGNLISLPGSNLEAVAARVGLVGLGIMVGTAAVHAMALVSRFSFRTTDIYRLSIYSMAANKRVSLGNAGILFVWCFVLLATTAWLVPFTAGPVLYLLCLNSKPLLMLVETKFTEAVD